MINLTAQPAELHFTLAITRAATGLTEYVEMVGHVVPPEAQPQTEPLKESDNGCNP